MNFKFLSLFLLFVLVVNAIPAADSEVVQRFREFRPVEAKKATIQLSSRAGESDAERSSSAAWLRKAWVHFDGKRWEEASDAFLSALEKDSRSLEAAEGLAMSVYRSGDFASAHRLGWELSAYMPSVSRIVAGTVEAEVRDLVNRGKLDKAKTHLAFFPASDPVYAEAHLLVEGATSLAASSEASRSPVSGGLARH